MHAKRPTARHIIIKTPKVKDKERILKAPREKWLVNYRVVLIRLSADFLKLCRPGRTGQEIFSHENQGPTAKIALLSKAII